PEPQPIHEGVAAAEAEARHDRMSQQPHGPPPPRELGRAQKPPRRPVRRQHGVDLCLRREDEQIGMSVEQPDEQRGAASCIPADEERLGFTDCSGRFRVSRNGSLGLAIRWMQRRTVHGTASRSLDPSPTPPPLPPPPPPCPVPAASPASAPSSRSPSARPPPPASARAGRPAPPDPRSAAAPRRRRGSGGTGGGSGGAAARSEEHTSELQSR